MEVQVAVLCDAAADYGGKLTVMGTFDTLASARYPARHPYCSLALRLCFRTEEEGLHHLKIVMIDGDGRELQQSGIDIGVSFGKGDLYFLSRNVVINMGNLELPAPGMYSFDVEYDGEIVARVPLRAVEVVAG